MLVKSANWDVFIYPAEETPEIISGQSEASIGGMPQEFLGNWISEPQEDGGRLNYLSFNLSPFYMMIDEINEYVNGTIVTVPALEFAVVSCNPTETAGVYGLVVIQPLYTVGNAGYGKVSDLTVDHVNEAFLDYLESIGIDASELIRRQEKEELDILGTGEKGYSIKNNSDAGIIYTNGFLSEDQRYQFQHVYMPRYCIANGFQPVPTYIKLDGQMVGSDLWLTQYKKSPTDQQNAFATLEELDTLVDKQDPFVCSRP